jgi:hypothetical protein
MAQCHANSTVNPHAEYRLRAFTRGWRNNLAAGDPEVTDKIERMAGELNRFNFDI